MTVNGIIAEYNPFHNGHLYQLEEARKGTGADYTIVAISGSFMQRGAPAILNKFARAEMALSCGADLVLEIPAFYAAGSAEYFASGALALLDQLGVVTHLCFGSECGNTDALKKVASILAEEPENYQKCLRSCLRQGYSFPMARSQALLEYCPGLGLEAEIFTAPNNILGLEYMKAISRRSSSIQPYTTKRAGSDYHDKRLGERQSSAMAIRQALLEESCIHDLSQHMPDAAYRIMTDFWTHTRPITANDFSLLLHYRLLTDYHKGYAHYADVTESISDRIKNNIYDFKDFQSFCDLLKSKDLTHTRISRCLFHILLGMEQSDIDNYREMDYVPYARVLGLRKSASGLLSAIKENTCIPLIVKLADAGRILDKNAMEMLEKDIDISHIYHAAAAAGSKRAMVNEYTANVVVVD